MAKCVKWICVWICGIEIGYKARLGERFTIHHGYGSIISGDIGNSVHVNQGVTIGGNWGHQKNGRSLPKIGDMVWIMAGARVLGPITFGSNVIIGANAVVRSDVPDNSVVDGIPARVIRQLSERDLSMLGIFPRADR